MIGTVNVRPPRFPRQMAPSRSRLSRPAVFPARPPHRRHTSPRRSKHRGQLAAPGGPARFTTPPIETVGRPLRWRAQGGMIPRRAGRTAGGRTRQKCVSRVCSQLRRSGLGRRPAAPARRTRRRGHSAWRRWPANRSPVPSRIRRYFARQSTPPPSAPARPW